MVAKEWVFGGQGIGVWWPRIEFCGQELGLMAKDGVRVAKDWVWCSRIVCLVAKDWVFGGQGSGFWWLRVCFVAKDWVWWRMVGFGSHELGLVAKD